MTSVGLIWVIAIMTIGKAVLGFSTGIDVNHLPHKSEAGQSGYNDCTGGGQDSQCQTSWIMSILDFCLFAPPKLSPVGEAERISVTYCTKPKHGARTIPKNTFTGVHYVITPHYVQITGTGNFTKIKIPPKDEGGELDPHGSDKLGNPIGGLVLGKGQDGKTIQFVEWTEFVSYNEFCIRACFPTKDQQAPRYCNHIYDTQGCYWNMPGNYGPGFDSCKASDTQPMGEYYVKDANGKLKTKIWHQGEPNRPPPNTPPPSYDCKKFSVLDVNPGSF